VVRRIAAGEDAATIESSFSPAVRAFGKLREAYLLYK
jgi:hypothetical protein